MELGQTLTVSQFAENLWDTRQPSRVSQPRNHAEVGSCRTIRPDRFGLAGSARPRRLDLMILDALHRIANHAQSLDRTEARAVMSEVLGGKCSDAQIAALLIALRMKG